MPRLSPWHLALAVALVAGAGALAWFTLRSGRPREVLRRLITPLRSAFSPNIYLPGGFALAVCVHLLSFLSFYLFARSLGIGISFGQVLIMLPVVLLLVLIPITVNGHGLREWILVSYFSFLHLSVAGHPEAHVAETVVALSALLVANDLLWSLPGGLFYLAASRKQPTAPAEPA